MFPTGFLREPGAGIAVATVKGSAALVVFMIDNGLEAEPGRLPHRQQPRRRRQRAAWTPWIDVPGWFSWENQGGGIAVADLDNTGGRDLINFQIDNAIGQNQAFSKSAMTCKRTGTGEWGGWLGVPHWSSWENQGGGIAVAEIGGVHKLFVINGG